LLQQDRKLYLTEEEWDARRKKCEVENHSGSGARGGGTGKGRGRGRGCRASPPVMSVGAATRWGIEHVSVT
jgi:hypothetical protein